jgi:hypothetical protein
VVLMLAVPGVIVPSGVRGALRIGVLGVLLVLDLGILTEMAIMAFVAVVVLVVGGAVGRPGHGFLASGSVRPLVVAIGEQRDGAVQLPVHVAGLVDIDAGPGRRHLRPDPLDDFSELGTGRPGHDDDVRVGRAGRRRPTAPGDGGLDGQAHRRAADRGHDQHVRTPSGGSE